MKKYTVVLDCHDGDMRIEVIGDFSFEAANHSEAMSKAEQLESKVCAAIPKRYYDKNKKEILFDIKENDLGITKGIINKCIWYDETKGPYLNEKCEDGTVISPIANPVCDTKVDINEFMKIIERENEDYLKTHDVRTFEYVAFGVIELEPDINDEK